MKFTQIPDKLNYPSRISAKLSTLHSDIITYVLSNFRNTNRYKNKVVNLMNTISYYLISGDSLPTDWSSKNPFENIDFIDNDICESKLVNLCLHVKDITWDVTETDITYTQNEKTKQAVLSDTKVKEQQNCDIKRSIITNTADLTPKEDLYIKPPTIPQLDTSVPWLITEKYNDVYVIYKSLPEIPKKQCQISCTTDISKMTAADLIRLFPNHLIHTRSSVMYEKYGDLDFDENLGVILSISGFSPNQVRENIIQYPHLYKLKKMVNGEIESFYSTIEINGEIHSILDIWDSLPDAKRMPKSSEYIKEYVARRYLLERDIKHIDHKYKMYGSLDPFLTLFTTSDMYKDFGYTDSLEIAKCCVRSRVNYKQTRNPIIRMVQNG